MSRRFLLAAVFLPFLSFAATAQHLDKIVIETTELSDSVYMLNSRAGGNMAACAGDDGILLVDSEYADLAEKVEAAVAKISDQPVKYVINTHWHFDHVGGNAFFAVKGSLILAHENVLMRMAKDQHIGIIETDVPASKEEALPRLTFIDSITFRLNGEEIVVQHFPNAHTDGDCVVHFKKSNVIHTGDLFFNFGYPFIDVSCGGNIDGVLAALQSILELCNDETRIIPGHGPLSNKSELKKYRDMLKEFRSIIEREIKAGKDLKTILAERPTAAIDDMWGAAIFPPDKFTEIVYRSLKRE